LLRELRIREAADRALAKIETSGSLRPEELAPLLEALLMAGDMVKASKYVEAYEDLAREYQPLLNIVAFYYYASLKVDRLRRIFPNAAPTVKALVSLNIFGDVKSAVRYAEEVEEDFVRDRILYQIHTVMGKFYPPPTPSSSWEEFIVRWLTTFRDLYAGKLYVIDERLPGLIDGIVDRGMYQVALAFKGLGAALSGKPFDLRIARMAAESLGLRRYGEMFKAYERMYFPDVSPAPPGDVPYMTVLHGIARRFAERPPKRPEVENGDFAGLEYLFWYMSKVARREVYLSFSGRLRLMRGVEEIELPRRKALVMLAFYRTVGLEFLKANAHLIFPHSRAPKRRIAEYMRYIKPYLHVPSDIAISRAFRTFLDEEREEWAKVLRRMMIEGGREGAF